MNRFGVWVLVAAAVAAGGAVLLLETGAWSLEHVPVQPVQMPVPRGMLGRRTQEHALPPTQTTLAGTRPADSGCAATVVSAFFEFASKHPVDSYLVWLDSMVCLRVCMEIYVDDHTHDLIAKQRSSYGLAAQTVLHRTRLNETHAFKALGGHDFWQAQRLLDPEARIHRSYWLYVVWVQKTFWLSEAAQRNLFGSSWFVWSDIGCWRPAAWRFCDSPLAVWPNVSFLETNFPKDKAVFCRVRGYHKDDFVKDPATGRRSPLVAGDRISGSIFLVHRGAAQRWADAYWTTLQLHAGQGVFIGKDQNEYFTTCVDNLDLCQLTFSSPWLGHQSNEMEFFFFEYYLTGQWPIVVAPDNFSGPLPPHDPRHLDRDHTPVFTAPSRAATTWQSSWRDDDAWRQPCQPLLIEATARGDAGPKPVLWQCGCETGTGDRWAGIRRAALLATLHHRPFGFETTPELNFSPEDIGVMPHTKLLDWQTRFATALRQIQAGSQVWEERGGTSPRVSLEKMLDDPQSDQLYIVSRSYEPLMFSDAEERVLREIFQLPATPWTRRLPSFCMLRALLRPTTPMLDLLESLPLGGSVNPFSLGLHVRFGNIKGDYHRGRATDEDLDIVLSCAWNMTRDWTTHHESGSGVAAAHWLLASDDPGRLQRAAEAFLERQERANDLRTVLASHGAVSHVITTRSKEVYTRLWLDILLLSESHACAYVRSGFPELACAASTRAVLNRGRVNEHIPLAERRDPHGRYHAAPPIACDSWRLP